VPPFVLQVTLVPLKPPVTVAVRLRVCPNTRVKVCGLTVTDTGAATVTVAVAVLLVSAWAVAVT
jgi:hypothetical protein